jgi:hypothetical protein
MCRNGGTVPHIWLHKFSKSRSYLKIIVAILVTCSKFHTEDQKISGVTTENLISWATWVPEFVHHRYNMFLKLALGGGY